MSADTPDTTPPAASDCVTVTVAGGIRPFRKMRGSAPISAELFTSTANPLVIAFQTSAMFWLDGDPDLTLPVLQQRWTASRRGAAEARRTLIELGYWVEVTARQPDGRFRVETRTSETRLTEDDLADLATEYAPSSVLECGGRAYVVTEHGLQQRTGEAPRRGPRPTLQNPRPNRHTTSGNPVRPAETPESAVTVIPPVVTRSDQAIVDNPVTVIPPVVTRSDQGELSRSAGRTELPLVVGQHASLSFREGYACMHDEFWEEIGRLVTTPIDHPGRKSVHAQLEVAFQAGWTPARLARWLGEQVTAAKRLSNPAGFVIARLREIPAPADVPLTQRDLDERAAAERRAAAEQRKAAIASCDMCDERGWVGTKLCDHDPEAAARNAHGSAMARAALAARLQKPASGAPVAPEPPQTGRRVLR